MPPADATLRAAGETTYWQGAGCSEMETFCPFTSIVPLRAAASPLADTMKSNDPLPCPLADPPSVTHDTPAVADHVQSRVVVTETLPVPPDAAKLEGDAAAVTWHRGVVGAVTDVLVDDPHDRPARAASTTVNAQS